MLLAYVFYFRPDGRLVAGDQAIVEGEVCRDTEIAQPHVEAGAIVRYATTPVCAIARDSAVGERDAAVYTLFTHHHDWRYYLRWCCW